MKKDWISTIKENADKTLSIFNDFKTVTLIGGIMLLLSIYQNSLISSWRDSTRDMTVYLIGLVVYVSGFCVIRN